MSTGVFEFILNKRREGQAVALATVVDSRGPAPVGVGKKMAVTLDESSGTVGGGALEGRVIEEAREALGDREPRLLHLNLDDPEAAELGMICGGEQDIFIDIIEPASRLLIFGGGHVGQALARLASAAAFPVAVVDDREEFLDPARYPDECGLVKMRFDESWADLGIGPGTRIVILTRGHAFDRVCLKNALGTPAFYIGMIGSRRKVAETFTALEEEGVPVRDDRRVYAPLGLDLGGRSPEEIAVSILAEIVAVEFDGAGGHMRDRLKKH